MEGRGPCAPSEPLFPTRKGTRRDPGNVLHRVVEPAHRRANELRQQHGQPLLPEKVTPHSLRRTWFTMMLRDIGTSARCEGSELRGRCCKSFWLRTVPCWALGASPPRDAELRGDLACRRLGSERKYVKRIHARDTGKAGRQFAR